MLATSSNFAEKNCFTEC